MWYEEEKDAKARSNIKHSCLIHWFTDLLILYICQLSITDPGYPCWFVAVVFNFKQICFCVHLIHSFLHSFVHQFIDWLLIYSFTPCLLDSFFHSSIHSIHHQSFMYLILLSSFFLLTFSCAYTVFLARFFRDLRSNFVKDIWITNIFETALQTKITSKSCQTSKQI